MALLFDSWVSEAIFLVATLAVYMIYRLKRRYSYFKDRNIPQMETLWLLGSTYKAVFLIDLMEQLIDRSYQKLKSHGYFGLFSFHQPGFVICDPSLVEQVLIKDFSSFHSRGLPIDEEVNPLDKNLFNMTSGPWRALRNKLSPVFTSGKLKWMYSQIGNCADRLVTHLENAADEKDIAVKDLCSRYGLDVTGSCTFGLEVNSIDNPDSQFKEMTSRIFKPTKLGLIKLFFRFLLPEVFNALRLKVFEQDVEDFFMNITKATLDHRSKSGEKKNDFVQILLQLKEKGKVDVDPEDKEELETDVGDEREVEKLNIDDALLAAQCFTFFNGGFEPSASLMSHLLYELARHPGIQSQSRREINEAIAKHGELTYNALKECTLLEDCISECLRLYSPNIALFRKCNKELHLNDGNVIEKGMSVILPSYSLHMDPDYYPEPKLFKPSRFSNGQKPRPGTYLPFGEGPRVCIARRFALLQTKLGVAKLLCAYELLRSPKNIEPLQRSTTSIFNDPEGGLWVRLRKLESEEE